LILAKSYLRHLCTRHHAHSAELIRHSRPAILPPLALMEQPLPGSFTELIVNFGDLKRDLEEGHK
jgi:hypothetical protein